MTEKYAALTWADRLTISRMIGAPLLLIAALFGQAQVFLALAVMGFATDIGDGKVARLLNNTTSRGAQLDSRADLLFYSTGMVGLVLLFPTAFAMEWRSGVVVGLAYAVPMCVGWLKFRRLTAYHTLLARIALCAVATAFFCWLWLGRVAPLRVATVILVLSAIEELAITWKLATPRDDVSHFFQLQLPSSRRSESCLPNQHEF